MTPRCDASSWPRSATAIPGLELRKRGDQMRTSHYLIAGGGMTADAACKGIRDFDPDGVITVVAEEPHPPYARPPLSKALWKGDEESTIWRGTNELSVDLRLGRRIVTLDLDAK